MSLDNQPPTISLDRYRFNAKIDYITILTPGKVKLPTLVGSVKWSRRFHGKRLTVHDAVATDIDALVTVFGAARLFELEIAVDIRPETSVPVPDRDELLKAVMVDLFARGLDPSAGLGMTRQFRAFYRRLAGGYMVRPFNKGLPRPSDQQLHCGRNDPVQVKGYLKRWDQGSSLDANRHVARVEVRLGSEGLLLHKLGTLTDLGGFRFRKKLSPYFRHVRGTARQVRANRTPLGVLLAGKQHDFDHVHHAQAGVGAFLTGGKRDGQKVRLLRDTPVNNRIGQALMRLERQLSKPNSCALASPETARTQQGRGSSDVLGSLV
jgi:hypothetical protein